MINALVTQYLSYVCSYLFANYLPLLSRGYFYCNIIIRITDLVQHHKLKNLYCTFRSLYEISFYSRSC